MRREFLPYDGPLGEPDADQSQEVRCLRQLHLRLPDGRDLHRPGVKRATIDRDECVECYTCFNGLSQEHLPPDARADGAEGVCRDAHPLRAGAGRLPDRRVRARRADVAARRPPRVLRSARAARVHRRRGPRHRRSQDQRRDRAASAWAKSASRSNSAGRASASASATSRKCAGRWPPAASPSRRRTRSPR